MPPGSGGMAGAGSSLLSGGQALGKAIVPVFGWKARIRGAQNGDDQLAGISSEDAYLEIYVKPGKVSESMRR
jgi:hypothetical protein